jgi:uncharacterized membrane protein YgcG
MYLSLTIYLFVVVVGLYNVTYPKQVDTYKQHDNNNDNNTIRNEKDDYENAMKLLNTIDEEIATTTTAATGEIQKCPFMHSVKKTKNQVSGQGKNRNPTTAYTAPWENDDNDDKSRSLLLSSSSTAKKCHDKHCNHCDDDDVYESDYDMEYVQSKENNYSKHYFLDSDHENSSSSSSSSSSSRGSSSGNNGSSSSSSSNGTRNIQVVKANKSQSSTFSIIDADERV